MQKTCQKSKKKLPKNGAVRFIYKNVRIEDKIHFVIV